MTIKNKITEMLKNSLDYLNMLIKNKSGYKLVAGIAIAVSLINPTQSKANDILDIVKTGVNLINTGNTIKNHSRKVGNGKNLNQNINSVEKVLNDFTRGGKQLDRGSGQIGNLFGINNPRDFNGDGRVSQSEQNRFNNKMKRQQKNIPQYNKNYNNGGYNQNNYNYNNNGYEYSGGRF